MFNFEKLDVWQRSVTFAGAIYQTTAALPPTEKFGLTDQMRRAAVSISSNIAEGSSRHSRTEFRRFVEIATGSTFEVVSQAKVAANLGWIDENAFSTIYSDALQIVMMLSGLRRSLAN